MAILFPFITSAPGKVIIFGEHSAVYNKPAIAAALSLRTYLLVTKDDSDEETLSLEFPDIDFSYKWNKNDLPFHIIGNQHQHQPSPSEELNPELVNELGPLLSSIDSPLHYSSAYTFLYLFVSLCSKNVPGGLTFTVRSTLPIGAGLGSSASISICLASAFSYLGEHIKEPTILASDITAKDSESCLFIDSWSFMGEKCIHGNPSGIDNAVATHGGAVMFQRMENSMPSVRTSMRNLPPLNLLLTNTKTPRRTATLVANVSRLVSEFSKTSGLILEAMESISREAYNLMLRPFLDRESKSKLLELFRINHGLLVSLGVSHPNLERVKLHCDELKVGETKLTGAGGGGCAITLLDDENTTPERLDQLTVNLESEGFETFQTTLGGKGVAMFLGGSTEHLTVEIFKGFKNRKEIEAAIGCSHVEGWKYW